MEGCIITKEQKELKPLNTFGSSRIRGEWLIKNWDKLNKFKVGSQYDFMILQKVYWRRFAEHSNAIKIFDICDADWLNPALGEDFMNYCNKFDAVVTSTSELRNYIKYFLPSKPVIHIPDRIDFTEHTTIKKDYSDVINDLAYFGRTENFITYMRNQLKYLNGTKFKLTVYSESPVSLSSQYDDVKFDWKEYNYPQIHKDLIKHDAVLLEHDRGSISEYGRYKSMNKAITCYALKIPVITTPEDLSRGVDKNDINKKYKIAMKEWNIKKSIEQWEELLSKLK
jgi:hypothetical protein